MPSSAVQHLRRARIASILCWATASAHPARSITDAGRRAVPQRRAECGAQPALCRWLHHRKPRPPRLGRHALQIEINRASTWTRRRSRRRATSGTCRICSEGSLPPARRSRAPLRTAAPRRRRKKGRCTKVIGPSLGRKRPGRAARHRCLTRRIWQRNMTISRAICRILLRRSNSAAEMHRHIHATN